jgi:hypothetical protein
MIDKFGFPYPPTLSLILRIQKEKFQSPSPDIGERDLG